jgi:glutamine amidotransferase
MRQFMHNGGIADFHLIKRKLQSGLSDVAFDMVNGNTGQHDFIGHLLTANLLSDSEWAFALFLSKAMHEPFIIVFADIMSCAASKS